MKNSHNRRAKPGWRCDKSFCGELKFPTNKTAKFSFISLAYPNEKFYLCAVYNV